MQKKIFLSIALTISLLLSPFILFYIGYVIKPLVFPFVVIFFYFKYVFISFFISIIVFIGSFTLLKKINSNIIFKIFLSIFLTFIFATISGLYETKIYIKNKSLNKFGKEPEFVSLCLASALQFCPLGCAMVCEHPHALVEKNGKYYYWSFKENSFFELSKNISCNMPYWRI